MVRVLDRLSPQQARPLAIILVCALVCSTIAILGGALGTLTYSEDVVDVAGLTLQHLRPLHTTFAVAWIYLAAVAIVYLYLISQGSKLGGGFWLRLKLQLVMWGLAGGGTLVSVCRGVFSGREYMGAHWAWSVLIYLGWILFAWNFFSVVGFGLKGKPVFIYMWYVSILLFLWSFAEGHAWHLRLVGDYPVRDIAMQWKSYGPLVGTFNLLVYGAIGYLACCLSGDSRYAYSNLAFGLFVVGVVNSFTNFGHHTYHLPQSHVVKWVSFLVSMAESIILLKYLLDVVSIFRRKGSGGQHREVTFILKMATCWSFLMVGIALVISVPPINTLIHGTHFVMAHAMGSMIGIDTMLLWGTTLYVIQRVIPAERLLTSARSVIPVFILANLAVFLLVALLSAKGLITGYLQFAGPVAPAPPQWLTLFPGLFMILGLFLAVPMLLVNLSWIYYLLPHSLRGTRE